MNDAIDVNFGMTGDDVYEHLSKVHGLGPFLRQKDAVLFLAHAQRHDASFPSRPLFPHVHAGETS